MLFPSAHLLIFVSMFFIMMMVDYHHLRCFALFQRTAVVIPYPPWGKLRADQLYPPLTFSSSWPVMKILNEQVHWGMHLKKFILPTSLYLTRTRLQSWL